jgi:peptide chain release factor 1
MPEGRPGGVFEFVILHSVPGLTIIQAAGAGVEAAFGSEAGGHRWQRIPPNEKRGRVHTSTITVVVLWEIKQQQMALAEKDLDWTTCRGSGPGGQHRNKTESAVQIKHKPSGLVVRCESERSQHQNRQAALEILRSKLWQKQQAEASQSREKERKQQAGSGMRGDKRRTVRCQDGIVTDHLSDQKWKLDDYLRGEW